MWDIIEFHQQHFLLPNDFLVFILKNKLKYLCKIHFFILKCQKRSLLQLL